MTLLSELLYPMTVRKPEMIVTLSTQDGLDRAAFMMSALNRKTQELTLTMESFNYELLRKRPWPSRRHMKRRRVQP